MILAMRRIVAKIAKRIRKPSISENREARTGQIAKMPKRRKAVAADEIKKAKKRIKVRRIASDGMLARKKNRSVAVERKKVQKRIEIRNAATRAKIKSTAGSERTMPARTGTVVENGRPTAKNEIASGGERVLARQRKMKPENVNVEAIEAEKEVATIENLGIAAVKRTRENGAVTETMMNVSVLATNIPIQDVRRNVMERKDPNERCRVSEDKHAISFIIMN